MSRINLLPVRALARLEQAKQELVLAALVYVGVGLALLTAHQVAASRVTSLQVQADEATQTLATLTEEAHKTEALKQKSAALAVKLAAIDHLRGQKEGPAPMLGFFVDVLAELPRVWLTKLTQQGELLLLEGGAMAQGDISAFQLALAERRPAFRDVTLALVSTAHAEGANYLQWTLSCHVPGPSDPNAKANAKAGP